MRDSAVSVSMHIIAFAGLHTLLDTRGWVLLVSGIIWAVVHVIVEGVK